MKKFTLALCAALVLCAASVRADILLSGNFQTGTPAPTLTISAPFSLSITATGSIVAIVFDEWAPTDGTRNFVFPPNGGTINYRINGGPLQTIGYGALADHFNDTVGSSTPNDGYMSFIGSGLSVTAGQTVTFPAQTLGFVTFGANPDFDPNLPPVFSGLIYATDSGARNLTSANPAPEPGTWALLGVGAGLLGLVRRRRRA